MGGSGLKNMQARAELINGTFKIKSKIGNGTVIEIQIPK
jgi:signal transduction histidine kinase